ncbi:MAG: tetratricopeptide repeat protein [Nitrospinota bacterium]
MAKVRGWERLARAEEEALRNDPDDVWARVRLGAIYIREGKYYKAEKQLSRAAAEMPTPVVLGPEGRINYAQEPPQGALPPWARVAGPQGQDLLPRYILILHHLGEGRGGEALSLSEDLLKGSPGDPLAVVLRARALELRGDGAAAEEALQGALEEAGQHPLILYRLGLLYREAEKHGQASSLFRKALSLAPDFRDARRGLALSLLAAGNPEEALPPLREALKEEPGDGALHNALGEALKALGRDEEAVSAFREGVRLSGGVVEYRLNLANLLQELGRKEEASEAFAEAGRLGRGNARALLAAARLKGTLGDIKAARSLIAEGLRISPEEKVPFYLLEAELLLEQGRGEAALDMLRRAQREAPTDAEVVLRLAGLYEDIHRPYLASAGYRRYLRLKPEGSAGDSLEQRAQGLEKEFEAEIERLMHSAQEAEALRRIKEDLAEIPDDPLLNLLLGRALLALGFIEEGRRALGLAEASFGDDPRYRLALAAYFM